MLGAVQIQIQVREKMVKKKKQSGAHGWMIKMSPDLGMYSVASSLTTSLHYETISEEIHNKL